MNINIKKHNGKYIITGIGEFDSDTIFDCGQCFRWEKNDDYWQGISLDKTAKVKTVEDGIELICDDSDLKYWLDFFDLEYDYRMAKDRLMLDADIAPMVCMIPGMRFLNQDFYECLMHFIISANNHIKRIKLIINKISAEYGQK